MKKVPLLQRAKTPACLVTILLTASLLPTGGWAFAPSLVSSRSRPSTIRINPTTRSFPQQLQSQSQSQFHQQLQSPQLTKLYAKNPKRAYTKKNKKKSSGSGGTSVAGLKGFGSTTTSSATSTMDVPVDRSKSAMAFYSFLESRGAGSNLKRVALGFFPFHDGGDDANNDDDDNVDATPSPKLRGIVALQKIPKGDVIIEIPYEAAWNLGQENNDPTLPGSVVLREYCRWRMSSSSTTKPSSKDISTVALGPYLEMLPPFQSPDVLGSTDFFSDDALETLQSPQIHEETLARRGKTQSRYTTDIQPLLRLNEDETNEDDGPATATTTTAAAYQWDTKTPTTEQHLRWATWLITSRVLTVQGSEGSNDNFRLMIPLIDMCNHDRDSPHILTGRAEKGGTLKVIAGKTVEVGEQVSIVYGGGVSGNDRFIQDYGFLDMGGGGSGGSSGWGVGEAFTITGKILMGKRRIVEGSGARGGRPTLMPEDEREKALAALDETSLEEDLADLVSGGGGGMADDVRSALEYRIGVKKALKALGHGLLTSPP